VPSELGGKFCQVIGKQSYCFVISAFCEWRADAETISAYALSPSFREVYSPRR